VTTLLGVTMLGCAFLSSFISNTAAAAFFLPKKIRRRLRVIGR